VLRAWRLAEAPDPQDAALPGLQARYALITATLSTRTGLLPAALLAAALQYSLWSPRRAVADAGQLRDPADRARLLALLVPHLTEPARRDALRDMIAALAAAGPRSDRVFADLPPELPGPAAEQALTLARSLADPPARARALHAVALRGPVPSRPAVLGEALDVALGLPDAAKLDVLAALVPSLPGPLRALAVPAALAAARGDDSPDPAGNRMRTLLGLVTYLPEDQLGWVLATARAARGWAERAALVAGLAPHLPGDLLREVIDRGPGDRR
jgi:hypothetical protein